jgi:RNA polymerase sigma-70 factor, ECF subfamily
MRFEAEAFPHLDALSRTAFWLIGEKPEADSLVCDTYAAAYRLWDMTVSANDFKAWIFKILTVMFCSSFQNYTHQSDFVESPNGGEIFPEGGTLSAEAFHDLGKMLFNERSNGGVRGAITRLPVDIRIVVILSFLEGFSYQEVADIAGIGLHEVRSRLIQGRKLIQWNLFGQVAEVAAQPGNRVSAG